MKSIFFKKSAAFHAWYCQIHKNLTAGFRAIENHILIIVILDRYQINHFLGVLPAIISNLLGQAAAKSILLLSGLNVAEEPVLSWSTARSSPKVMF
ncbi:hypothetical protein [Flavobacterium saccharophilum]|uniref:Uncharacterized protein n=1 Tax=Flavobacterium saccharophilum TaxID=29534 RepID=A0A1M7FRX0_9FLAO|nr:hypothetical protein [Flavobacterium saccharophilum]SHM06427.1 hypothetical protein SAMN05444366_2226 [Flavobacterium saccharophilum]